MGSDLKVIDLATSVFSKRSKEVIDLPIRPEEFDFNVGYGCVSKDDIPPQILENTTYLCQTDWPWSQKPDRFDAYYLHKGRTEWSLWSKYWNDETNDWKAVCIGIVNRDGVDQKQAAIYLLLEFWKFDAAESNGGEFHWINEEGYLTASELDAIARAIW